MIVAWQPYPPGPFFLDGRWSNGPVWAGAVSCVDSRMEGCLSARQRCERRQQGAFSHTHLACATCRALASTHQAARVVADTTGFQQLEMAIGSSTTNKTTSFHGVGDFYPSSLLSKKKGARNVTLPTLSEAVTS